MDLKTLQDTPPWEWPKDAGRRFQKILTDRQASKSDRLVAAELAGDPVVMNDGLAGILTSLAGNAAEPEDLRAQAAIALGPVLEQADTYGFDDPEDVPIEEDTFHKVQESLRKAYEDQRSKGSPAANSRGFGARSRALA